MIRRLIIVALAVASLGGTVALVQARRPTEPVHYAGHINCPPGSHGKPHFDGVGQALERAREEAKRSANARPKNAN
jgi:hypothetical protein